ncbi:MAG: ABC transporter substrate-binding protein [Hyphomicrobiaceae bacterium]|nr:ABC transporter substrate-binding protein [Hyphomicrobiaceae bacterium]
MHGEPAEAPGFEHFKYVNPDAPKGGQVRIGVAGSFDNLNPLIVKGNAVAGMREYVFETLLARSLDEPFSLYGLIAQSVEMPEDRREITFNIDPRAKFSDGHPITADDVIFSWRLLRDKGRPNHRAYYAKVTSADRISDHAVRFVFDASGDREMPLILGLMPVLPQHAIDAATYDQTTLTPLIGSGPYRVARVDAGRAIVYERNRDYWGADLPVNRGRFNFDEVRFEYYRDVAAMFEAFKTGAIDVWNEEDPARWADGYDIPAVAEGRIVKTELDIGLPAGMAALVFNTRRDVFADPAVRRALIELFDFEWLNRNLYHGLYKRTESYFERSSLSAHGRTADATEHALLEPFAGSVRPDVLEGRHAFPTSDGSGQDRGNLRRAFDMLKKAGYTLDGRTLVHSATRRPLAFEFLATSTAQERLLGGFVATLSRLGIAARIRVVDSAQYQSRVTTYDFDMIQATWPSSLSPGNEQIFRWDSRMAATDGTYNWAGVANPAADAMIAAMLAAKDRATFVSATRALDRVLVSGDYVIPLFHLPKQWVAYWRRISPPERTPLFGYSIDTWWHNRAR